MAENPRIDELRRRVQKDPASIAFAQLAEEHRRAGEFDEAISVCRAGLAHHPGYLSARVTLGRALLAAGEHDEAQAELEQVLRAAPDNLAAIRALAEIHQHTDEAGAPRAPAEPQPDAALPPAPVDLDLSFAGSDQQFVQALETLDAYPIDLPLKEETAPPPIAEPPDPTLTELEAWLAAILTDREARRTVKARPADDVGRPFTGRHS